MPILSRNVLLAIAAASVVAGCKTTTPRDCDNLKPNVTYHGKCCGIGDAPCREGKNGNHDRPNRPDPRPQ
ncbi:hypothetical protein EN742_27850 [Mesorhizobium sp. M4A.F.Ca.ET.020.02.1.1]|uniref:hypothetical protein n=1 Tax=unclassified Mesorhizobium TaxID=325217 RepID=UPI000FCBC0F9|nr:MULTISPECIES: hypothetical protein [unclassified Mesorhizobium]RVD72273.1 hypothetical protein EN751_11005 [Mesorhizobium sp. M4A.F.Ca.ET.029.04.2.1]RUX52203.1 hypothetical protein EOA33_03520 [Mesorhizobium sp. M4A.F.Ca.ET.050.02.1.1]RVC79305.1 hypothetical protein EN745_16355 [Mesorhizobium sp. M4A.F.Ca.ET.022.05.2.1]RVD34239.1 hypothetical protein EN742_27850 [Mesorhizobium sp. M4A.F.Ca.ET.020.02.1.1]RWC19009.1 MAG: hypothetical protein EOS53_14835 [Mesorhizobium sp.]